MAKAQVAARFVTEVAPSKAVASIMRRRRKVLRSLDTIVEDEMEHQLASYGQDHNHQTTATSSRAGLMTTELPPPVTKYSHGQEGVWEQSSRQAAAGRRRPVYA
ncbi:hypothetical protein PR202_ga06540 [Eleusine coracana subsp. coracana]|uniref:Uncharacterized protein n=1 Tax=Eleusine coracana subsp. coracana TaxID=191504 RepID=A0AAV5BWE6_ELECO|nr:hypothetical protein PR202_ga06540 [Eleusine coracana subsp. coracana]